MNAGLKEQDFARHIYGATVETIVDEYAELLIQYREHVVKELAKSITNELCDSTLGVYVEYTHSVINVV